MRCPHCQSENTHVIDTTHDAKGGIRRRRECEDCGERFSTYERAIQSTPLVIKKDNTREVFDPNKLRSGIIHACHKRPVAAQEINQIVSRIEQFALNSMQQEITTNQIGEMVMEALRELEPFLVPRNVGRNEPCPCGSGRKFKACCARGPAPRPLAAPAGGHARPGLHITAPPRPCARRAPQAHARGR